jgi:hypothetical protein
MLRVRISIRARCTWYNTMFVSDLRQVGGCFPDPPVSSTNKTDRHDITWLWNFRVSRGFEIPVSQVVMIFQCLAWLWNFSVSYDCRFPLSHVVVEFQCLTWLYNSSVSRCYGIPDSHMVVEFQCFTWLWNASNSHSCGIPVFRMDLRLLCLRLLWNIAMWDTGIPQPRETVEIDSHMRHWNSTTMRDTGIS